MIKSASLLLVEVCSMFLGTCRLFHKDKGSFH